MAKDKRQGLGSYILILALLFVLLVVTAIICLMAGSADIGIMEIFSAFTGQGSGKLSHTVIFDIRLPRIFLALAAGGGLAIAGAVFQALLMNPLAEPYILGVSSGGTFGAVLSFLLGLSMAGTQLFAFAGALSVIAIVFFLGKRFGNISPNMLLLSGVMTGAFFSAAILLLYSLLDDSLRNVLFWLIGNLSSASKGDVYYILPLTIIISMILTAMSGKFNILSLGDQEAHHLGVNTGKVRMWAYVLSSIMTGAIVSISGIIGFVGLLVPHVCRILFGNDNRIIVPASFLTGASYMIIMDTIAKSILLPVELPVGAFTALFGAPVFIYLLRTRYKMI